MMLPGFSAGGGITGPSSPGDIYVTPTISPTIGSPLRPRSELGMYVAIAAAVLLVVLLKGK